MRRLVVYFSRRGATATVAHGVAEALGCRVEALVDTRNRAGVAGYWCSFIDSALGRETVLEPIAHDPAGFDLIVVGTPVWNASVSAPVRTYLGRHRGRLPRVAFFCSFGGWKSGRAFRQMAEIAGQAPVAALDVRRDAVEAGAWRDRVRAFAEELDRYSPR